MRVRSAAQLDFVKEKLGTGRRKKANADQSPSRAPGTPTHDSTMDEDSVELQTEDKGYTHILSRNKFVVTVHYFSESEC